MLKYTDKVRSSVNPTGAACWRNRVLALDISYVASGWAVYDITQSDMLDCGVVRVIRDLGVEQKALAKKITRSVFGLIEAFKPYYIVYEKYYFEQSTRGLVSARLGITADIIYVDAWLESFFEYVLRTPLVFSFRVNEWKGQVPKDVVIERMKLRFPHKSWWKNKHIYDHNAIEACALALFFMQKVYGSIPEELRVNGTQQGNKKLFAKISPRLHHQAASIRE